MHPCTFLPHYNRAQCPFPPISTRSSAASTAIRSGCSARMSRERPWWFGHSGRTWRGLTVVLTSSTGRARGDGPSASRRPVRSAAAEPQLARGRHRLSLRSPPRVRGALPSRRPLSLRPQRLGLRPAPLRRGHAARRARSPGRAPDVDRRHQWRALRGVGAQRAARIGRRRLQRLGRPRAPDAPARAVGHLGGFHPRPRRRRALQIRDPDIGRPPAAQGGSVRALLRDSAAVGGDRLPHRRLRLGRRRVDGGTRRAAPAREAPDGDLRGAPRVVADRRPKTETGRSRIASWPTRWCHT